MSHKCKSKDGNIGCISCYAAGEEAEQNRIIDLLKVEIETCEDNYRSTENDAWYWAGFAFKQVATWIDGEQDEETN